MALVFPPILLLLTTLNIRQESESPYHLPDFFFFELFLVEVIQLKSTSNHQ